MKIKRMLSLLLATTVVSCFFAGCSPKEQSQKGNVEKYVMWSGETHSKLEMEKLVDEFNQTIGNENGICLEYIVSEDTSKQIEVALQTGQEPDFFGMDIKKGAEQNYIVAIEDMPGGEELLRKYEGKLVEGWHKHQGKTYRLPKSVTTMGLIYNKDMFKAAGIVDKNGNAKPPRTIKEMVEYAKRLTNNAKRQYGIILPLKWSAWFGYDVERAVMPSIGHSGFDPKIGKYDYSGYKPMLEALMQIKADESYFPGAEGLDNDPARARFAEGNVGMKIGYSWDVGVLNDQFPAKCDWGVAPIPTYDSDEQYLQPTQPGFSTSISARAAKNRNPEHLMIIFEWLNSDDVHRALYKKGMYIPWSYDIVEDVEIADSKKGWVEFAQLLEISTDAIIGISVDRSGKETLDKLFLNEIWSGNKSIDEVLEQYTNDTNEGMKKYQKTHPEYDPSIRIIPNYDVSR